MEFTLRNICTIYTNHGIENNCPTFLNLKKLSLFWITAFYSRILVTLNFVKGQIKGLF